MSKVLVVGDVITDIIVIPDGPMVRGSDRRATIRRRPGGSGANQAVWLAAAGVDVRFVARVAAADREQSVAYFGGHGVEALFGADNEQPSGVLISVVDPDGERSFFTDRGANLNLSVADLPDSVLDGVGMVLVSGYSYFAESPRGAVMRLMQLAHARGIATAVDPASVSFLREVGAATFLDWTAGIGTLFANHDEALELTGLDELGPQMAALGQVYPRVVIKRGRAGAAVGGHDGVQLSLPSPVCDVVDSTGAGDAFAAAFIGAELRGEGVEQALRAGVVAGAEAVTRIGGQPPTP
jgi:sugar/nucleoside kinase (ribokinase family)